MHLYISCLFFKAGCVGDGDLYAAVARTGQDLYSPKLVLKQEHEEHTCYNHVELCNFCQRTNARAIGPCEAVTQPTVQCDKGW
jgi:hypothetical protein